MALRLRSAVPCGDVVWCCTTSTPRAERKPTTSQRAGSIPGWTGWTPAGSPPQPAQLCPGYPAAAEGGMPARLAPTANPPGISPAHQLPSLGRRGGCRGLFPTATWRKNTEKDWGNELQKVLWLEDLSLFTLSKRWPSPTSTQKRHFWGQVAFKIKVKSITRHRRPETK